MRGVALALIAAGATGCLVYDNTGSGFCEHGDCGDDLGGHEDGMVEELSVAVTPPQAEVGETFIAYMGAETGSADFQNVSAITFYGDVVIDAMDQTETQIVLSLSIPDTAVEGEVDMVVEWAGGGATWTDAALTIYPSGSGNGAGEWDPGGDEGTAGGCGIDTGDCDE